MRTLTKNKYKNEPMRTKDYNNWYKNKDTLEEVNIRFYNTEEWISDLQDKIVETTHSEQ